MRATISIMGLTNFDESIWDNFQVPTQANREDLIDEILLECSDFELLYPDWDVMKGAIGLWSRKELPIWERLFKAKELEYNPLWNVDAKISEIRDVTDNSNYSDNTQGNNSKTGERNASNTENLDEDSTLNKTGSELTTENITENKDVETNGTSKKTGTESTNGSVTTNTNSTHKSNTFNSGGMIDNSQDITNTTESSNNTTTFNTTVTDNETIDETDTTQRNQNVTTTDKDVLDRTQSIDGTSNENTSEQGSYDEVKTGEQSSARHDVFNVIRQGNIGVTSSQQLLTEEWEVSQFDPNQYIIDSFKQRFCLLVY